jgi:serine O-acetyltransferase
MSERKDLPPSEPWDLHRLVADLRAARLRWRQAQQKKGWEAARAFPSRIAIEKIAQDLRSALFPMRLGPSDLTEYGEDYYVGHTLNSALSALLDQVRVELSYVARDENTPEADVEARSRAIVGAFADTLPEIRTMLDSDVQAAFFGDPAARSVDEVLICYPGLIAIIHHRLAHALYALGAGLIARVLAEIAHSQTGVDIHPGAQIGAGFFIDHGTGVVIGETSIIGERVRLYQAVTLGAKSFPTAPDGSLRKGEPRHPIIGDDVVIYAGATILGRVTIGKGSIIGGNVWLTESVAPGSRVAQAVSRHDSDDTSNRALAHAGERSAGTSGADAPDERFI